MEPLAQVLLPYKGLIGTVASYLTIAQFFSGVFICLDIRKKGSCKDVSSVPFVGGIMLGLAFLKYGLMLQDQAMLTVNTVAITLNAIYCICYYFYSTDKWNEFLKPLSLSIAFVAALWGYCEWEDPKLIEHRYGLIVTVLMLLLLGNPLLDLKQIIEKKDASQIPFVLTLMGTLVTFTWLLYSVILMNTFMLIQNVVGFILCFVQLVLIFMYPGKPPRAEKKKKN